MQEGETNIIQFTTNTRVAYWQRAKSVSTAGGHTSAEAWGMALEDALMVTAPHHTTPRWLTLESRVSLTS